MDERKEPTCFAILAIHGKAGSGKSTVAKAVAKLTEANVVALADPIKDYVAKVANVPVCTLWGDSDLREDRLEIYDGVYVVPRELLVAVGDAMRNSTGTSLPALYLTQELKRVRARYLKRMETAHAEYVDTRNSWYFNYRAEYGSRVRPIVVIIPDMRLRSEYDIINKEFPGCVMNVKLTGNLKSTPTAQSNHITENDVIADSAFDLHVENKRDHLLDTVTSICIPFKALIDSVAKRMWKEQA